MGYQVFRIKRGTNLHIIHETRTGKNRTRDVYTLCRTEPAEGERDKGTATCAECLDLDDPFTLHRGDVIFLRHLLEGHVVFDDDSVSKRMLVRRDLITPGNKLTRRGRILAADIEIGPAPIAAVSGIVHARNVFSKMPLCGNAGVLDGCVQMSVERYGKLRALDLHVTCIPCLNLT